MRCILLVSAALVLACLVSCGSRADRPSLVAIDSLILQAPDSACELLADYPEDSFTTADDRAYHALLTTIARYKAYRPATSDSTINIALSHYDHNGANPDKRMRSLLYKGCVMEELGEVEEAIEYYKRAETLCPADDYFHIGYINMRMASLYQNAFADSIPIDIYKKALTAFRNSGNAYYESQCNNSLGLLYSFIQIDSASNYIYEGIKIAEEVNDTSAIYNGYEALCHIYYRQGLYEQVVKLAQITLVTMGDFANSRNCFDIVSISFSKLGLTDSATKYYEIAPPAFSIEDSILQLRAYSEIALIKKDIRTYEKTNEIVIDKSDSLLLLNQAEKIRQAEAKYDMAQKDIEHLSKQKRYILIIVLLLFVSIAVAFLLYFQRQKTIHAKVEHEEALAQLSALNNHLNEITSSSDMHIHELKKQVIGLQKLLNEKSNTQQTKEFDIQLQLQNYINQLQLAERISTIHNKTRMCLDEILRLSFYSGRYNSDHIIDNDDVLNVSPDFWNTIFEIVEIKHNNILERITQNGTQLKDNEKKLLALCAINIPSAIIRRILNYKNIQVVSNLKRKLAKKITGKTAKLEDILNNS